MLKKLDHMNENMKKHLNGKCVISYTPSPKKQEEKKDEIQTTERK